MARTIFLVRHGRYDRETGELTERGIEGIVRTAEIIKKELETDNIKEITIYSSPRKRARQSAQIIAETIQPIESEVEVRGELDVDEHKVSRVINEINSSGIIVSHLPDLEKYLKKQDIYADLSPGDYKKLDL